MRGVLPKGGAEKLAFEIILTLRLPICSLSGEKGRNGHAQWLGARMAQPRPGRGLVGGGQERTALTLQKVNGLVAK